MVPGSTNNSTCRANARAQASLELMAILLPRPPSCQDYCGEPLHAPFSDPIPYVPIVAAGYVFRQCGSDGQWGSWRDHTQCESPETNGAFQVRRDEGFRLG